MTVWHRTKRKRPKMENPVLAYYDGEFRVLMIVEDSDEDFGGNHITYHRWHDVSADDAIGEDLIEDVEWWMELPAPPGKRKKRKKAT